MSTEQPSGPHETVETAPDERPIESATGGETEARPDKETRGIVPGDALYRKAGPDGFVIPPAEWGKTEGAPSGGVAGGAPTEEWEEDERERVKESDAELTR
jgi:hypothetical protein